MYKKYNYVILNTKEELHMKNIKVLEILDNVENYIENEDYFDLLDYVQRIKKDINIDDDPASKYIDDLVGELK